ncbi:hypothetical protein EYZ11_010478 [Aspergillus tanneri]|uniref:Uncharacterized protein n=1 Tax=Aspergillus tanneri TaxID=1220188 RepID=A0A4S3J5T6_9EURO|nr:hypothetical protein EYZ11_010478 [Aspergillus tanneri]
MFADHGVDTITVKEEICSVAGAVGNTNTFLIFLNAPQALTVMNDDTGVVGLLAEDFHTINSPCP